MKYQALFSLKNNERYSRLSSAPGVIGALRVSVGLHFNVFTIFTKEDYFCDFNSFSG